MNRYEKCQRIVANKQSEKIDGYLIDMTSASLYCQVWEKINEKNRATLEKSNTASAIMFCYKLISK